MKKYREVHIFICQCYHYEEIQNTLKAESVYMSKYNDDDFARHDFRGPLHETRYESHADICFPAGTSFISSAGLSYCCVYMMLE